MGQSADDLIALLLVGGEADDVPAGREAAQIAVPLDEQHIRTLPGGGDRGGEAPGAAAHNDNVRLLEYVQLSRWLVHAIHGVSPPGKMPFGFVFGAGDPETCPRT